MSQNTYYTVKQLAYIELPNRPKETRKRYNRPLNYPVLLLLLLTVS